MPSTRFSALAVARALACVAVTVVVVVVQVCPGPATPTGQDGTTTGADVNVAQQDAFTPLHEAAQNGDRDIVGTLLAAGADSSAKLDSGETAADLARKHNHPELAPLLERTG